MERLEKQIPKVLDVAGRFEDVDEVLDGGIIPIQGVFPLVVGFHLPHEAVPYHGLEVGLQGAASKAREDLEPVDR